MTLRVALIEVSHESNTFSMRPTTLHDFATSRHFVGAEMIARMRGTGSEIGGALAAAEALGWQIVPILAAQAQPAGPVTEAARQAITGAVVAGLREAGPLDGIFLALHGAMVTETDPDGESQLLRAIRAVVGPDLQMLDLNIFRAVGIEPARKSVVAVKSMQHFRGAFEPIATRVLVVDAGGLCTPNVARRTYRRLLRPVFPLDAIAA